MKSTRKSCDWSRRTRCPMKNTRKPPNASRRTRSPASIFPGGRSCTAPQQGRLFLGCGRIPLRRLRFPGQLLRRGRPACQPPPSALFVTLVPEAGPCSARGVSFVVFLAILSAAAVRLCFSAVIFSSVTHVACHSPADCIGHSPADCIAPSAPADSSKLEFKKVRSVRVGLLAALKKLAQLQLAFCPPC